MSDEFDYPFVIKLDGDLAEDPEEHVLANYGDAVRWRRAEPHPDGEYVFRLVGFVEKVGNAALYAYCAEENIAGPLPGKRLIRWWPDAPLYAADPPPASAWFDGGIESYTNPDGMTDWAIGHGEAYFPSYQAGPCAAWVSSEDGPSDLFEGWGWLDGTQYQSLAPIFERVPVESEEEPEEPEEPEQEPIDFSPIVEVLEQQNAQLERIAGALEKIVAKAPVGYSVQPLLGS